MTRVNNLRVLVLRADADARQTARRLAKAGHEAIVAPLIDIRATSEPMPDGPFDALVITSAHAIPWLALPDLAVPGLDHPALMALPLFAVGDRSAMAARDAGFSDVRSAQGTRTELAALLAAQMKPQARLLLALGRDHKADLAPRLQEAGFIPVTWLAYEAVAVTSLPEAAATALQAGTIDAVLHYSRRSAETFLGLANSGLAAGLIGKHVGGPVHVVLSEDVAEPLRAAGVGPVVVASRPDEQTLIETLSNNPRHSFVTGGKRGGTAGSQADAVADRSVGNSSVGENMSPADNDPPDDPLNPAKSGLRAMRRPRRVPQTIEGEIAKPVETTPVAGVPADGVATEKAVKAEARGAIPSAMIARSEIPEKRVEADERVEAGKSTTGTIGPDKIETERNEPGRIDEPFGQHDWPAQEAVQEAVDERVSANEAPAQRNFGLGALIAAGLIGGLAGSALALALPRLVPGLDTGSAQITDIGRRLTQVQDQAVSRQALQGIDSRIEATAALAAKAQADASTVSQRLGQLLASAPANGDPAAIAGIADRARRAEAQAAETATRLAAVEQAARNPAEASSALRGSLRLVLLDRIARALDGGRSFSADLRALSGTGVAPERIKPLEAVAGSGVATLSTLQAEFRSLRPALEQDATTETPSIMDRLSRLAQSAISVRSLGAQTGTSPTAVVSRLGAALSSGDLAKASAEWVALPEPARRASADFGQRLTTRAAAERTVADLSADALGTLGSLK